MNTLTGVGVRYVVYWHLLSAESGQASQALKVNLIVYENDVMQVTGTSFFLWVLDSFHAMLAQGDSLLNEVRGPGRLY